MTIRRKVIALDQRPRDAEGNAFAAHPRLFDGGFAHGRLPGFDM